MRRIVSGMGKKAAPKPLSIKAAFARGGKRRPAQREMARQGSEAGPAKQGRDRKRRAAADEPIEAPRPKQSAIAIAGAPPRGVADAELGAMSSCAPATGSAPEGLDARLVRALSSRRSSIDKIDESADRAIKTIEAWRARRKAELQGVTGGDVAAQGSQDVAEQAPRVDAPSAVVEVGALEEPVAAKSQCEEVEDELRDSALTQDIMEFLNAELPEQVSVSAMYGAALGAQQSPAAVEEALRQVGAQPPPLPQGASQLDGHMASSPTARYMMSQMTGVSPMMASGAGDLPIGHMHPDGSLDLDSILSGSADCLAVAGMGLPLDIVVGDVEAQPLYCAAVRRVPPEHTTQGVAGANHPQTSRTT